MKKILLICALSLAGLSSASAIGVGIVGGGGASGWGGNSRNGGNVGLSLGFGDVQDISWDLAIRLAFRSSNSVSFFRVAVDADWHIINYSVVNWFQLYVAVGPYAGLGWYSGSGNNNNTLYIDFGGRLPLGVRFIVFDRVDIWLAFVPSIGIDIGIGNNGSFGLGGGLGGEIGIRFWF